MLTNDAALAKCYEHSAMRWYLNRSFPKTQVGGTGMIDRTRQTQFESSTPASCPNLVCICESSLLQHGDQQTTIPKRKHADDAREGSAARASMLMPTPHRRSKALAWSFPYSRDPHLALLPEVPCALSCFAARVSMISIQTRLPFQTSLEDSRCASYAYVRVPALTPSDRRLEHAQVQRECKSGWVDFDSA